MKRVNRMSQPKVSVARPDFEEEIIEFENEGNSVSNRSAPINSPAPLEIVTPKKMSIENENEENEELKKVSDGSLRSETVTILPAPLSQRILSRLERQKNKYWHFKFVKESDYINLEIALLKEAGLTVQPNYGGKKHADLTLFKDGVMVGKIHLLHANRPDICDPTTFYVKLHFYDFENDLFEFVKNVMITYFHSLDQSKNRSNFRGGKKTRKQKRNARRKTRRS